ncbi:MAG: Anthranilate phosphoribosyltransferase [Syntrophomonadaceae bacterium]|nr:Anthranilate phosphoribosyltransferase [Bacillota bacterium]
MKELLGKLCNKENLTTEEASRAMTLIMTGEATPAQVGAFLAALKMKGETAEEIYGCALTMRQAAEKVPTKRVGLTDTCGTGGDGSGTFNISTAAALIAAGAGLAVAKHGNRAVSGRCGSADVLEALGAVLELTPEEMGRCLDEVGIAFLYAPVLHKSMRHAAAPRREVGVRSVFNLLGPLTNPAGAKRQVLGVYAPELVGLLGRVLLLLGTERALVVHGSDGSDELTLAGETACAEIGEGTIKYYQLTPEQLGLRRVPSAALRGGGPLENAAQLRAVLSGESGVFAQAAILNAAAALYVGGLAEDLREGASLAEKAVNSGEALSRMEALINFTREAKGLAGRHCRS